VAHVRETRKAFGVLVGKPEGKEPREGLRAVCSKHIERNIKEM